METGFSFLFEIVAFFNGYAKGELYSGEGDGCGSTKGHFISLR